jgi:hypothetical protein
MVAADARSVCVAELACSAVLRWIAADAKAFDGLCAAELSYSHSDGHVEDKATFIKNATAGKSKFLSLEYWDPSIRVVGDVAIVRFHWLGESETIPDGKKSSTNPPHPNELAKTRRRMEPIVSCVHQTLTRARTERAPLRLIQPAHDERHCHNRARRGLTPAPLISIIGRRHG